MVTPRRVGAEKSNTRIALLEGAERLMVQHGYAAVTYRRVAASAGVTSALVQYYFPKRDDLFVAMLEWRSQQNLERLLAALESRPDEPLRVVWEFSADEQTAALTVEFMALANHRKTIRAEILEITERARRVQLEALEARWSHYGFSPDQPSASGLLFLMHAIPKMAMLEESLGLTMGHREMRALVETRVGELEPRRARRGARR